MRPPSNCINHFSTKRWRCLGKYNTQFMTRGTMAINILLTTQQWRGGKEYGETRSINEVIICLRNWLICGRRVFCYRQPFENSNLVLLPVRFILKLSDVRGAVYARMCLSFFIKDQDRSPQRVKLFCFSIWIPTKKPIHTVNENLFIYCCYCI